MSHWVLTVNVNDYDQHGDYYVKSWGSKPSAKELSSLRDNHAFSYLSLENAEKLLDKLWFRPNTSHSFWGLFTLTEIND